MQYKLRIDYLWIGYVLILIGCTACANNKCSDVSPPPIAPVVFYFTDKAGNNLINDKDAPFHPDSVRIQKDKQAFPYEKEYDPQLKGYKLITYPGGKTSGSDLLSISLSSLKTDSLEVLYTVRAGECFSTTDYTVFFFNGKEVYMDTQSGILHLIKNL